MKEDLKKQIYLPIILTLIFIVSSFIPILQIIILTLDGGLISLASKAIGQDISENLFKENIIFNLIPTLILLFLFYKSTTHILNITSSALAMIFMTAFFMFLTDGVKYDSDPYFLNFILVAFVCGIILTLITFLKYLSINQKEMRGSQ